MPQPAEPGSDAVPAAPLAADRGEPALLGSASPASLSFLDLPAAGEFTRLSLWMAGALAGVATPTHAALAPHCRAMARRVGWTARGSKRHRPGPADALALLADAVIGTSRAAIASAFGVPPCAAITEDAAQATEAAWGGPTWYYPVRSPAAVAVAIEFDGGHARRVAFVGLEQFRS